MSTDKNPAPPDARRLEQELTLYRSMVNASHDSITLICRKYIYRVVNDSYIQGRKKKREEVELKNEADNLIYAAEKLVKQDLKDKVSPEHIEKVNKVTQELRDAIASSNIESIKTKVQELKSILAEISTKAYQSVGAAQGPTPGGAQGPQAEGFGAGPTGAAAGPNPSP